MKNILKYGVVPLVVSAFLVCITLMLLPVLINVQKFLPQIEKQVAQHTGRSFSVGSDFGLTFFPWLSVTFSDMHLGNPEGVAGDNFIEIASFEARVKLLPLFAKKVEVSRFVVSGLNINMTRELGGDANWEMFHSKNPDQNRENRYSHLNWLFERDVAIELLAVTGGNVTYVDKNVGAEHKVEDLMVLINNVSSTDKAKTDIKAVIDGHQMRGMGSIGPVSRDLGSLATDLRLQFNDGVQVIVKGECSYPIDDTTCDLNVRMPRFSLDDLYEEDPGATEQTDGNVLSGQAIELEGRFLGNMHSFNVNGGSGMIDETSFTYALSHDSESEVMNKLDIHFTTLDLDRYFSHETLAGTGGNLNVSPVLDAVQSLPFSAQVKGDELTFSEIDLQSVAMQLSVVDGLMDVEEGTFTLHGGKGSFNAAVDLGNAPVSIMGDIELSQVQAAPLSKELTGSPFISGSLGGMLNLKRSDMAGSDLGMGFMGHGHIEIDDGTVAGLQLIQSREDGDDNTTDFDQLAADLTLGAGVVHLKPISLVADGTTTPLSAVVQLDDKTFTVSPLKEEVVDDVLSIAGSYGPQGLAVKGFTDVHETKVHEMRDAQTLVDETMPAPVEEDVSNIVGTPLIDPAIVAERFGLRPETIKPGKMKKAYNVGRGRVIIHDLKELNSSIFIE